MTKIAIEAAEDPEKYLFHSFYDMCRGDYRGRMLRAFPTFYCIFMDEGREIGLWKLHDNFYSINAIHEISIVKSRKIASDTCHLVLSNNYSTFTTDDEDGYVNYKGGTFGELWDDIFNPKAVAKREVKKRMAASKVNKAKLQPGIRINVRQGYGSDARELGCVFNGVIAEVQPGAKVVEIVAQGNGIELMNPILDDRDADEIQFQDLPGDALNNTSGGGATPKTILNSFLTTRGGAVNKYVQGHYSKNQWFFKWGEAHDEDDCFDWIANFLNECWSDNPYGIRSFGDRNYTDIIPEGEITQNIYEVASFPCMDQDGIRTRADFNRKDESPYISFDPRGKTIWDIMHICRSVAPDYFTGIVDFGFRSSIFFGKPHYYYAYDYTKVNGIRVEKRKPYQQYHFYYSDSDIISNNITASTERMNTVATGLYKDKKVWITSNEDVGPLYVDKDIYPEYQKSMLVDTRLKMKDGSFWKTDGRDRTIGKDVFGWEFLSNIFQNTLQDAMTMVGGIVATPVSYVLEDFMGTVFDDKGKWSHHKRIAWTATATALKDSVKEMYQGGITVIGDPTVKPNDRILITDFYNDMNGQVLVRDVVHTLSASTGFTTTINVDAISVIDDQTEFAKQFNIGQTSCTIANTIASLGTLSSFAVSGSPYVDKYYDKMAKSISGLFNPDNANEITQTANEIIEALNTKSEATIRLIDKLKDNSVIKAGISIGEGSAKVGDEIIKGLGKFGKVLAENKWLRAGNFVLNAVTAMIDVANNMLIWPVKNHQVLTIFPLKKNGLEYVAGLDGSQGLVYGSSSYNETSIMEKIFADLIPNNEDGAMANLFKSFFLSDAIQEAAQKYRRDYKYIHAMTDNTVTEEFEIESLSLGISRKGDFHYKKNITAQSSIPRALLDASTERNKKILSDALNPFYVENIESILRNEYDKNHSMIEKYEGLKPYIEKKFLKIIHQDGIINKNSKNEIENWDMIIGRQRVSFNGIKVKTHNNSFIDIPFLSKDGLEVLKAICEKAYMNMIGTTIDIPQHEEDFKGSFLLVKAALRVGSRVKMESSGYSFIIEGFGELGGKTLENLCNEIIKEEKEKIETILKSVKETKKDVKMSDYIKELGESSFTEKEKEKFFYKTISNNN
jgi:hypothetical protein